MPRRTHPMRRIEIVCERPCLETIRAIVAQHATGYTIVPEILGFGHHGHRAEGDLAMLVTVVTKEHVDPIVDAVQPILDGCSGVITLTTVDVVKGEYFVPEIRHQFR